MVIRTALALCLFLAACSSEPLTELLVVSRTDLDVPSELDAIRFVVRDASDRDEKTALRALATSADLPAVFAIVQRTADGDGPLVIEAIGERDGEEVLRRTARVSFVAGRAMTFRLDLLGACMDVDCGDDETCGESGCRAVDVDDSELEEWPPSELDGGRPTPRDGAIDAPITPRDGSTGDASARDGSAGDASSDAAVDSGVDAGPPECVPTDLCDDGVACTVDACTAGSCVHLPSVALCNDAVACTTDTCDETLDCQHETVDAACDDGIACTAETCDATLGCRVTAQHAECAAGSYCDTATDCTAAPTFTAIHGSTFTSRCVSCHKASSPDGQLDLSTRAMAYAELVGVPAVCSGGGTLVIPHDARQSLLWRKVAQVDLCGARMPRTGSPLNAAQILEIERWIEAGALDN